MTYIIILQSVFIAFSSLVKVSFFSRTGRLAVAVCCALGVYLMIPWLIRQSPNTLHALQESKVWMQDLTVLITLEAFLMIAFCFYDGRNHRSFIEKVVSTALKCYPGLLISFSLTYANACFLFTHPGINFTLFAWISSAMTLVAVYGGSGWLRWLLREQGARLEVLYLVNLFLILLCIVAIGSFNN